MLKQNVFDFLIYELFCYIGNVLTLMSLLVTGCNVMIEVCPEHLNGSLHPVGITSVISHVAKSYYHHCTLLYPGTDRSNQATDSRCFEPA